MSVVPNDSNCGVCGHDKLMSALICPNCKLPANTDECKACKKRIPYDADFCNECKAYQKLRFIPRSMLGLSLATALLAVATTAVNAGSWLYHYPSRTHAAVIRAHRGEIEVYVWNTGQNPSAVVDAQLHYSGVPLEDPRVVPAEGLTRLIQPNNSTVIKLTLPEPVPKAVPPAEKRSAELWFHVRESNGDDPIIKVPLEEAFIDDVLSQKGVPQT